MDKRPIGVFDSGVGGLTAVRELRRILPGEQIVYFGDTARVPYGSRSAETIQKYAKQAIRFLASFDVKAILAACGTVSCNLTQQEFASLELEIPYFTVLDPVVKEAATISVGHNFGLMATSASVASGAYQKKLREYCPDCQITQQGCPLLVGIVEAGLTSKDHPVTKAALEMYLEPMKQSNVDTLILGCTHFPLLREAIAAQMGDKVPLLDAGAAAARTVKQALTVAGKLSGETQAKVSYYVTDTIERFAAVAEVFLTEDISGDVSHVDVEEIAAGQIFNR